MRITGKIRLGPIVSLTPRLAPVPVLLPAFSWPHVIPLSPPFFLVSHFMSPGLTPAKRDVQ